MSPACWALGTRVMLYTFLIAAALLAAIVTRYAVTRTQRCPECGRKREEDAPICSCGWIFEYPEDCEPLEYGEPDDHQR